MDKPNTKKKVYASMVAIVLLFCMLAATTYALIASLISVDNNLFEMGQIKIELNDGKTIFDSSDFSLEPGRSIKRDFTVKNTGSADVYYRLYLENVTGDLQSALLFEIYDGEEQLFSGTVDTLKKDTPCVSDEPLAVGETRTLTAVVKMREDASNVLQNSSITFDVTVDAVQARNNSQKAFE